MEKLIVKGSKDLPEVSLDAESGILNISGRSLPAEAQDIYVPVLEWVDEYAKKPKEETVLNFELEYCNSFSKKFVLEILNKMRDMKDNGNNVIINWHYEEDDDETLEEANIYQQLSGVEINAIPIKG